MKPLLRKIQDKRGDGYLDTVLSVLILCFVMVFILSAVSLILQAARLQQAADRLCEYACEQGHTDLKDYVGTVQEDTGMNFTADFSSSEYLDAPTCRVQLGDAVRVTLTAEVPFLGFGNGARTLTLTATATGLGRVYWK